MDDLLSSRLTFFNKYIFSILWIGGFGFGTLAMFIDPHIRTQALLVKILFLVGWLVGSVFIYWICGRIKRVERLGDKLLISNYFQEIEVPLTEVESVSEPTFWKPELICIKFRRPTIFGSKIVFMPKIRLWMGVTRHPLVSQLNAEIKKLKSENLR